MCKTMIDTALQYYGQKEVDGPGSNPIIIKWINEMFPNHKDDSTLAWCSVFMNVIAKQSHQEVTGKANARSWLKWGRELPRDQWHNARPGDVVVFWRYSPTDWRGHVALFVNWRDGDRVRVLGGNQQDAVNIRSYYNNRILSIRRAE